jgi:hypothetical protein
MTDERLAEIEMLARKYGSANCWTGTSGGLASVIIELLNEVVRLRDGIERDRVVCRADFEDGFVRESGRDKRS